jgi:hypothetical protein
MSGLGELGPGDWRSRRLVVTTYAPLAWNHFREDFAFWLDDKELPALLRFPVQPWRAVDRREMEEVFGLAFGAKLLVHWGSLEAADGFAVVPCEMA